MEWIPREATPNDALRAVDRLRKGRPGEHGWHYDLDVIETVLRAVPRPGDPA